LTISLGSLPREKGDMRSWARERFGKLNPTISTPVQEFQYRFFHNLKCSLGHLVKILEK
jgi:hypothetical protein